MTVEVREATPLDHYEADVRGPFGGLVWVWLLDAGFAGISKDVLVVDGRIAAFLWTYAMDGRRFVAAVPTAVGRARACGLVKTLRAWLDTYAAGCYAYPESIDGADFERTLRLVGFQPLGGGLWRWRQWHS